MIGVLALVCAGLPTSATADQQDELTRHFARCTGQLSALMEFQWLMSDPAADQTETDRARMIDLLRATMPANTGRETLAMRINAKHAFTGLLTRSHFNDDPDDIAWAQSRIAREVANCRGLLLN